MPALKEAAVAVTGVLLDVEFLRDFETKKTDGSVKAIVNTGDGFAAVKIGAEEARGLVPIEPMKSISWMVRYGAYGREGNSAQTTCRFVREVIEDDLDKLNSARAVVASSGKN